ncbi:hypothetical protein CC80DRAFT_487118 [Byssothecium circinans]|uniref:Uncharacterized protein n=1 Tax=Byssothecium circinans TaxID=147558 RepID=A0A6A5UG93_9PLEO|nr:hypothetical protein CC80DRAFT_487118 [Byssothecium circinans]
MKLLFAVLSLIMSTVAAQAEAAVEARAVQLKARQSTTHFTYARTRTSITVKQSARTYSLLSITAITSATASTTPFLPVLLIRGLLAICMSNSSHNLFSQILSIASILGFDSDGGLCLGCRHIDCTCRQQRVVNPRIRNLDDPEFKFNDIASSYSGTRIKGRTPLHEYGISLGL